jgi:hypothetical protein
MQLGASDRGDRLTVIASLAGRGGVYYEHTIDRSTVRKFYQKQQDRSSRRSTVVDDSD